MRNYRIVRISDIHCIPPMVALYKDNPGLGLQSYAEQQKALFQSAYGYAGSFSRAMRSLGHDAHEIVYDLEILQKTWAREKGVRYDRKSWQQDIVLAQIKDIKPDIIYFQDIHSLPYSIRKDIKTHFPFVKLVVVYKGYPGAFNEMGKTDVLLVATPALIRQYRDAGLNPYLVYHSFDEAVLGKMAVNNSCEHNPKYDFTFVGSSGYGYGLGHQFRYWALVELIKGGNLEPWIHDRIVSHGSFGECTKVYVRKWLKTLIKKGNSKILNKMANINLMPAKLKRLVLEVIEQRLPARPLHEMFPHKCHAPVFGIDMYRVLRQSKIVFNMHTDAAGGDVGNMRMFETTGVGTCLLTDTGKNMSDLFAEGHEVVTYSSIDECIEKVNYLLKHDDIRRRIAAAGQRRTLKDHTAINRCQQIDDILQKML